MAVACGGVGAGEAVEAGVDGVEEEDAEARVGGALDLDGVVVEFGDEGGKLKPLVDGGPVDAHDACGSGDGAAHGAEGDGGALMLRRGREWRPVPPARGR